MTQPAVSQLKGCIAVKIELEELIVRKFEPTDEMDLCEYMLQRVNAKFEAYPNFTRQKARQVVQFRSESDEFFAIELKATHKVIGNIFLGKRDFNARELGFVLNENYHRKGYASAASRAMVDYAFSHGVHRIYAECAVQNTPSWKLMEKIGLSREAHFRKNVSFHIDANGKPIYWDTYVYAALNPNDKDEDSAYLISPTGW